MQKVVGSNPIIRSSESPGNGAFLLPEKATSRRYCKRFCKQRGVFAVNRVHGQCRLVGLAQLEIDGVQIELDQTDTALIA